MPALFVDKTIEIDALPFRVWDVLTRPELNSGWAPEFTGGSPFRIESDWRVGAPVLWKDPQGQILVEGNVAHFEREKFLRFTVFDVRSTERPAASEQDGITFELTPHGGRTLLHLRQGDFSSMPDGAKYRDLSAQTWDRALPRIKALAEQPAEES